MWACLANRPILYGKPPSDEGGGSGARRTLLEAPLCKGSWQRFRGPQKARMPFGERRSAGAGGCRRLRRRSSANAATTRLRDCYQAGIYFKTGNNPSASLCSAPPLAQGRLSKRLCHRRGEGNLPAALNGFYHAAGFLLSNKSTGRNNRLLLYPKGWAASRRGLKMFGVRTRSRLLLRTIRSRR